MTVRVRRLFAALVVACGLVAHIGRQPVCAKPPGPGVFGPEKPTLLTIAGASKTDEPSVYIIRLADPPVANYRGGTAGLEATSLAVTGGAKLDSGSPASRAYADYLAVKQGRFIGEMERTVGHDVEILHQYKLAYNGMAVKLTPAEAAEVTGLYDVAEVRPDWVEHALTDYGPAWINAPAIWDGSATGTATMGEGVVVGVFDTGINMDHPSFADIGGDGYDHANPRGKFFGWCDPLDPHYDPALVCNDKLIGVWSADGDSPEGARAHGSHVASTAAGNVLNISYPGNTAVYDTVISGVAPHANIISYNIEGAPGTGTAPGSNVIAAAEAAIAHQVDVINYSFGADAGDPWFHAQHWLAVRAAGIFVATSAGNSGPEPGTIGTPANAPWLLSVGFSSHNRVLRTSLVNMTGGAAPPSADLVGAGFSAGYGPAPIVHAQDYGDALCLDPFPSGTFQGEIVVCDRGQIARVDKGAHVLVGGAGGYVLANAQANSASVSADDHYLPAVHITYEDAEALRAWLASGTGHTATILPFSVDTDPDNGDLMNASSSRGPNFVPDILKPDVTAPGTDILGAEHSVGNPKAPPEFGFLSGSSMSSPHVAGAAALLRALHPGWTPAEIQSALMSTAVKTGLYKEDATTPADPFDVGGGRVDVSAAAMAGLVLDETTTRFEQANPATGGDPKTLNLASMADTDCLLTCSWTREIRSTLGSVVQWSASSVTPDGMALTVTPASFALAPGATQVITVEAQVGGLPGGEWTFGRVDLTPASTGTVGVHFPVAVLPSIEVLSDTLEIHTRRNAGSQLMEGLTSAEITHLTLDVFGLAPAAFTTQALYQDPTPEDAYDFRTVPTGTFHVTVDAVAGAKRLLAEISSSAAPDLDLFVGQDLDGDGPEESEELCRSTAASWHESCELTGPAPGNYWVLVQSWEGSTSQPDEVVLITAVIPRVANGNMTVTGPASVPQLEPYDLRVFWDTPSLQAGDRWYGAFDIGADPEHPGSLGTVWVTIIRHEDDVVKRVSPVTLDGPGLHSLTYTTTVQPNVTLTDLTYYLVDEIPAGMTYVPGSAGATAGTIDVVGNEIIWSGVLPSPAGAAGTYAVTTNASDLACDTGFGGYIDLEAYGILPSPVVAGDTGWWTAFAGQNPFQFYGIDREGMSFSDDGFGFFDSTPGLMPWVNRSLPDPAEPNDLMAILWTDLEIVYQDTPGRVRGVSLASSGPEISIIEYDDVEPYPAGGTTDRYDFEAIVLSSIDDAPGAYEIVYAYDNLAGLPISTTVGVEDADGARATEFLFGDPAGTIGDDLIVCLDYILPNLSPVEISYQVEVDVSASDYCMVFTSTAEHNTNNPGSVLQTASAQVRVLPCHRSYLPQIFRVNGKALTR